MTNSIDLSTLLLLELLKKKQKRHCSPKPCCCCCCPCPPPPIPNPCPPPTLPNEPLECGIRRQTFAVGSPYVHFELGFQYFFFNTPVTFAESTNICASLGSFYHLSTVDELLAISSEITAAIGSNCPTLIWAIQNGTPTLVYIGATNGIDPIEIAASPAPPFCRAYTVCVAPLE
ncbi:hypothetical protein P5616_028830 (plasmid) [Priestia aryabhattai]|uniref:hypothetical protein n=1 Tax=Priestia aryabhattai TaxID=412384 RepID=UPI002452B70E|nr:hypothetical protein [Priestia aryabhattai]MDH3135529.1 hypothetical protein [Priestia aryabhattai]